MTGHIPPLPHMHSRRTHIFPLQHRDAHVTPNGLAEGLAIFMQPSLIEKLLVDFQAKKVYYCVYKRPPLEHIPAKKTMLLII